MLVNRVYLSHIGLLEGLIRVRISFQKSNLSQLHTHTHIIKQTYNNRSNIFHINTMLKKLFSFESQNKRISTLQNLIFHDCSKKCCWTFWIFCRQELRPFLKARHQPQKHSKNHSNITLRWYDIFLFCLVFWVVLTMLFCSSFVVCSGDIINNYAHMARSLHTNTMDVWRYQSSFSSSSITKKTRSIIQSTSKSIENVVFPDLTFPHLFRRKFCVLI